MKKLMIAMAAIVVGLAANAGSVRWNAYSISSSAGNALSGANQYIAYLFISADSSDTVKGVSMDTVLAQIALGEKGNIADLAFDSAKNTYVEKTGLANFSGANTKTSFIGSATALVNVSAFAVILDSDSLATAKNYMLAKSTSTASTVSADGLTITQGFGSSGDKTYGWGLQTNNSWTAIGGSSVPEPTSGMLLMFGLATLALRRRRA
jgi:hypothetical protein